MNNKQEILTNIKGRELKWNKRVLDKGTSTYDIYKGFRFLVLTKCRR